MGMDCCATEYMGSISIFHFSLLFRSPYKIKPLHIKIWDTKNAQCKKNYYRVIQTWLIYFSISDLLKYYGICSLKANDAFKSNTTFYFVLFYMSRHRKQQ
jgi:hypothetical protein